MQKKRVICVGAAILLTAAIFAQDDGPLTITLSRIEATKALLTTAQQEGSLANLQRIVDGLNPKIAAEAAKQGPFVVVGGRADQASIENDERNNSGNVDPAEVGEIGKWKAAKYGIWVIVNGFTDVGGTATYSGISSFRRTVNVSFTMTINDLKTSETIATSSQQIEEAYTKPVMSEQAARIEAARSDKLIDSVAGEISRLVIAECNDVLYPAVVMDVTDGVVTVSRGGNWCEVGEVLDIYSPAKQIQHKITKKMINVKGKHVGTMTVTSVESDYCQGSSASKEIVEDCIAKKKPVAQEE